jgi:hypothetical protein
MHLSAAACALTLLWFVCASVSFVFFDFEASAYIRLRSVCYLYLAFDALNAHILAVK